MPLYLLRKYLADLNSDNLTEGEHFFYQSSRLLLKIEAVAFLKIWVGSEVFSKPYPDMLGCVILVVPFLLLATLACGGLSMLMKCCYECVICCSEENNDNQLPSL